MRTFAKIAIVLCIIIVALICTVIAGWYLPSDALPPM